MSRRSFTLVELLVVVAIIAILAALLLPGLERARLRAGVSSCAGRQRDVAVGFHMFLNDYERFPDVLNIYQRWPEWTWDGFDTYLGSSKNLGWIYPCGAGPRNDWLIATVPHWCAPVRNAPPIDCVNDPQNRVHIGCHISRRPSHILDDWAGRFPLLCCDTKVNVPNTGQARGKHLINGGACGSNIAFLDGRVEWRSLVGALTAPHPGVWHMYRDAADWKTSSGLWVFGYGGWSILLPQEIHGTHPDQTNIINQVTGWPDSVQRPYWMR